QRTPGHHEPARVRLKDERVAYSDSFLLLVVLEVEGDGHRYRRQVEGGLTLRGQVEKHNFLAALQIIRLLVGRRGLVVTLVEVGRQKWKDVVDPVLVVGACELRARLPRAPDRPEGHGTVRSARAGNRLFRLLCIGKGLPIDELRVGLLVESLTDVI